MFPGLHLYPSGQGEMITVVTADAAPDPATLAQRASALQEKFGFRFALPGLLARRIRERTARRRPGELLTDDFAPVNLYDTIGEKKREEMTPSLLRRHRAQIGDDRVEIGLGHVLVELVAHRRLEPRAVRLHARR